MTLDLSFILSITLAIQGVSGKALVGLTTTKGDKRPLRIGDTEVDAFLVCLRGKQIYLRGILVKYMM